MFWLDAKNAATAEQGFNAIGTLCKMAEPDIENVKLRLGSHSERWLLIIDNADNPKTDYANYIPSGGRGDILITTRIPDCAIYGTVGSHMLDGLTPELARSLLLRAARIPENRWKDVTQAATAVVEALKSHTLAIVQAGAYIRSNLCTIEEYPTLFREQRQRLLQFHSDQVLSTYGNVYATFEISAEYLQNSQSQADQDALELLHIIAFLNNILISEKTFGVASQFALNVLETGLLNDKSFSRKHILRLPGYLQTKWSSPGGRTRWRNACSVLVSLSIVKITDFCAYSMVSLHSLVHAWAKERQDHHTRREALYSAATILALGNHTVHTDLDHRVPFLLHWGPCLEYLYEKKPKEISDVGNSLAVLQHIIEGGTISS